MEITNLLRHELVQNYKTVKKIEIIYSKKEKIDGYIKSINEDPLEVLVSQRDQTSGKYHLIDFEKAEEITVYDFDDQIKVFKDA